MNLVLLAGASGNTEFWSPLIELLPDRYTKQVIAYPSFHGIAANPDINSFDDLADYVVGQIKQPSILIAQSMGGIFAIKAALEKTALIKGLILIATSGGVNLERFQVQDWRNFYLQEYAEYPNWFTTTNVNYEEFISSIDIKTLLIWGDHDPISPTEVGKYLNHLIQKSDLYIVEGGDHQLAEKCADEVAIPINKFLKTV